MGRQRTKYHVSRRVFLNREATMPGFVIGVVQDTREIPNDHREGWRWATAELTIADCQRRITFDLSLDTKQERIDTLKKLNRLTEVVTAVRDAIETEIASLNARPKLPPVKKEKK